MLKVVRVFQSITEDAIHGGVAEQNDPAKRKPRNAEIVANGQSQYTQQFVMKEIVDFRTDPCIHDVPQHGKVW